MVVLNLPWVMENRAKKGAEGEYYLLSPNPGLAFLP